MAVFRPSLLKREKMPPEKRDLRRGPQINDLKIYARIPSERLSRRGYLPFATYFLRKALKITYAVSLDSLHQSCVSNTIVWLAKLGFPSLSWAQILGANRQVIFFVFLISVLSRGEKELAQYLGVAYHDPLYTLP